MAQLLNVANVGGIYQTMEVTDTTQLVVELSAASITKEADKHIWLDDGSELTYTIVVRNVDLGDPDDPETELTQVVVTDRVDPDIAEYVEGSMTLAIGTAPAQPVTPTYDPATGMLSVSVGTLRAGEYATITFRVARK